MSQAIMGYDDLGALEVGWGRKRKRRRGQPSGFGGQPGVPKRGWHLQPMGLTPVAFLAASGLLLNMTARPQRPFKGQRLVLDVTRTGATATALITVNRIDVGADNQLISSGPLPAAGYQATAIDTNVVFDVAYPGIDITVQLAATVAPAGADRIDVGGMISGTAKS